MDQGKYCEEGPVHERRHFKNRDRMHYDLQEGELYSVHYDQRKELGRGKFGVVYHVKVRFRFQFNIKKNRQNRHTSIMLMLMCKWNGAGQRNGPMLRSEAHQNQEA